MNSFAIQLANTILTRFPDPDKIPYKPWCYVQGYVLCGFEKLWQFTGDPGYFAYIQKFVDQHVDEDGSIRDFHGDSMDDMMAGSTIITVYKNHPLQKYRLATARIRDAFKDYPRNSDGTFWHGKALPHEFWIDGVFMGGMFLTRYGKEFGDITCFDEAALQIITLAKHCRKGNTGIFLHAFDETKQAFWADPITGLSPEVWSEGLGWYALILVETLTWMPANHPQRRKVMEILLELLEALKRYQDSVTGLWYQVVDKGHQPGNWQDTSGSAMFLYAIQSAIDLGYIQSDLYTTVVEKGYNGLTGKMLVSSEGLIDIMDACDGVCVQESYAKYIDYPRSINAKEAVGGCLWAASIIEKPVKKGQ